MNKRDKLLPSFEVTLLPVGSAHLPQLVLVQGVRLDLGVLGEYVVELGRNEPSLSIVRAAVAPVDPFMDVGYVDVKPRRRSIFLHVMFVSGTVSTGSVLVSRVGHTVAGVHKRTCWTTSVLARKAFI